jgi:hypothetical protein
MAHLTLYLPTEIEKQVRAHAKAEGMTVNRWIATQITRVVQKSWSPEFLAAAGADPDFPEIEEATYGSNAPREPLD